MILMAGRCAEQVLKSESNQINDILDDIYYMARNYISLFSNNSYIYFEPFIKDDNKFSYSDRKL